jgi:hypothetical protein
MSKKLPTIQKPSAKRTAVARTHADEVNAALLAFLTG